MGLWPSLKREPKSEPFLTGWEFVWWICFANQLTLARVLCQVRATNPIKIWKCGLEDSRYGMLVGFNPTFVRHTQILFECKATRATLIVGSWPQPNYNANQYSTPRHPYQHKNETNKYLVMVPREVSEPWPTRYLSPIKLQLVKHEVKPHWFRLKIKLRLTQKQLVIQHWFKTNHCGSTTVGFDPHKTWRASLNQVDNKV